MARVYVGTYKKYNNGSIAGKWIDLSQFKNYDDFVAECRRIHKDERDPELMIQDYESFPDGLSCGEWICEDEFNDIIQALNEERIRDKHPTTKGKELMEEYLKEISKAWSGDMLEYFKKKVSSLHRLSNGGILSFDKPKIETSFCFGYSDSAYDTEDYDNANHMAHHAATSEEYFLEQNLKYYDDKIKTIEDKDEYSHLCISRTSYSSQREPMNVWDYKVLQYWQYNDAKERNYYTDLQEVNDEDRKIILNALKEERAKFEKRLKAYLKRYGLSKVKSWSYWRDA